MQPRLDDDSGSEFVYPTDRLLKLGDILSAKEMHTPNNTNSQDRPMRYVVKRGLATLTTIGCLTGFESHTRRYAIGKRDSIEAAVYPYDNDSGAFSARGDSGSVIVDGSGNFAALLTGGAGLRPSSDITYGTPMHWLWEVIKAEFPQANLSFDD